MIIHRDLKPENILVNEQGYCILSDLGISKVWSPINPHESQGTTGYISPEICGGFKYGFNSDYFSVGIIAYESLIGKVSFI